MMDKTKRTTDLFTGKAFRWNTTVFYDGFSVPAYCGAHDMWHLHPSRTPYQLLRRLNPGKTAEECAMARTRPW